MKKFAAALLVFALLVSSAVVWAESETTTDTGIWEKRAYVDEFDLPTDEYYISNKEPIVGKFSNSATTDSPLCVYIYVDDDASDVSIRLIEYGSNIVKNPYSDGRDYDVAMMDTFGEKYYFDGTMYSGYDQIFFTEKDSNTIIDALCENGTVRFAITEADNAITKYNFTIEDTTGFFNVLPYNEIGAFSEGLAKVGKKGKYGYIDTNGDLVIPCEYSNTSSFSEGLAAVQNEDGKWGFIDTNGDSIIPYEYDESSVFVNGLAAVNENGKYGFIDTEGKIVVPYEYDDVFYTVQSKLFRVELDDKYGYIDANGNLVIPCEYDNAGLYIGDLAAVCKNEKWGFVNADGRIVVPCDYDSVGYFSEGMAAVVKDGKYGYVDNTGNLVIPHEYDKVYYGFNEGLASVYKDENWGVIDKTGATVIPFERTLAYAPFGNGLSGVFDSSSQKWGFVDTNGDLIIPYQFDDVYLSKFDQGIAKVKMNEKWGFIDTIGNAIFPCEYENATYAEGYFVLLKDGEISVISRDEVQPGWEEELAAHEQELAEQAEARKAEAEAQRMLMEYTDKETIQSVQTALNEAGYDCGTPDGIAGKNTQAAISAFQKDNSLNETGTATHELLLALGIIEE